MTFQSNVLVMGYASLDFSMGVNEIPQIGRTSLVTSHLSQPWPELGGVARFLIPLEGKHCRLRVISWIGEDLDGKKWLEEVVTKSDSIQTVTTVRGDSPRSMLLHIADSPPVCIFDPGITASLETKLNEHQRNAISVADWIICAVGPSFSTQEMLARVNPSTKLIWVVKADRDAFPVQMRNQLRDRADVIVYGSSEKEFVWSNCEDHGSTNKLIIETNGNHPIKWRGPQETGIVSVPKIAEVIDTVGAGDVFAAWLMAHIIDTGLNLESQDIKSLITNSIIMTQEYLRRKNVPIKK